MNIPRIQVETRPVSGCHATVPVFFTAFDDSNATARTAAAGAIPSAVRVAEEANRPVDVDLERHVRVVAER